MLDLNYYTLKRQAWLQKRRNCELCSILSLQAVFSNSRTFCQFVWRNKDTGRWCHRHGLSRSVCNSLNPIHLTALIHHPPRPNSHQSPYETIEWCHPFGVAALQSADVYMWDLKHAFIFIYLFFKPTTDCNVHVHFSAVMSKMFNKAGQTCCSLWRDIWTVVLQHVDGYWMTLLNCKCHDINHYTSLQWIA